MIFFFFKQKTAYDMRISDWSSDVALPISAVQRADGGALRQYRQLPEAALLPEPARRGLFARQGRSGVDSRPAETIAGGMALSPAEPLRFHPRPRKLRPLQLSIYPLWHGISHRPVAGARGFPRHRRSRAHLCPDQELRRPCGERAAGAPRDDRPDQRGRSEEHTSELQSLMRTSYAVFCLKKKKQNTKLHSNKH